MTDTGTETAAPNILTMVFREGAVEIEPEGVSLTQAIREGGALTWFAAGPLPDMAREEMAVWLGVPSTLMAAAAAADPTARLESEGGFIATRALLPVFVTEGGFRRLVHEPVGVVIGPHFVITLEGERRSPVLAAVEAGLRAGTMGAPSTPDDLLALFVTEQVTGAESFVRHAWRHLHAGTALEITATQAGRCAWMLSAWGEFLAGVVGAIQPGDRGLRRAPVSVLESRLGALAALRDHFDRLQRQLIAETPPPAPPIPRSVPSAPAFTAPAGLNDDDRKALKTAVMASIAAALFALAALVVSLLK
jgi:hypothetical protein